MENDIVTFRCPNCGQKLKAPESHGGWIETCPRCRHKITVPESTAPGAPGPPSYSEILERTQEEPSNPAPAAEEEPAKKPRSKLMEVLLYPCSPAGLLNVLLIASLLLWIRHRDEIGDLVGGRSIALAIMLCFYACCYLVDCVDGSAQGRTRAPGYLNDMIDPDEVWERLVHMGTVCLVCLTPVSVYYLATGSTDAPFWMGVGWAAVIGPMTLVGALVLHSREAFRPLFLVRSIARVLLRYLVLAVLVAGSMALVFLTVLHVGYHPAPFWWLNIVPAIAMSYWIVILAHLIGRLYPDNEDRLDWDI